MSHNGSVEVTDSATTRIKRRRRTKSHIQYSLPLELFQVLEEEYEDQFGPLPYEPTWAISEGEILNSEALLHGLLAQPNLLNGSQQELLSRAHNADTHLRAQALTDVLNQLINARDVVIRENFPSQIREQTRPWALQPNLRAEDVPHVNRLLFEDLFPKELARIHDTRLKKIYETIHKTKTSALCLSGGGIRSATFALGVCEALASSHLLTKFNYLSTVSGGGYLGGWLTAWMHRHSGGGHGVQENLSLGPKSQPTNPVDVEPVPVRHLRAYSNYLTPKVGLLSIDTWTLIGTYVRNLLVNWLIIVPLLVALLLVPRAYLAGVSVEASPNAELLALWGGTILAAFGLFYVHFARPSIQARAPGNRMFSRVVLILLPKNPDTSTFVFWCLIPLLASSVLLTLYCSWIDRAPDFRETILWAVAVTLAARLLALILPPRKDPRPGLLIECCLHVLSGAVWGAAAWLAIGLLWQQAQSLNDYPIAPWIFAVPLFWGAYLLAASLFVGMAGQITSEEDREWWSRFGAWLITVNLVWCVLGLAGVVVPLLLIDKSANFRTLYSLYAFVFSSGLASLALGKSGATPSGKTNGAGNTWGISLQSVASIGAMAFLFLASSLIAECMALEFPIERDSTIWILSFIVVLIAVGNFLSRFVSINKFSLHAMYRNRLIRAYLGASRDLGERHPNPFTGFDPTDNVAMHELRLFSPRSFNDRWFDRLRIENDKINENFLSLLSPGTCEQILLPRATFSPQIKSLLADDLNALVRRDPTAANSLAKKFHKEYGLFNDSAPAGSQPKGSDNRGEIRINLFVLELLYPGAFCFPVDRVSRPLHVVNTTLNLVRPSNLAWQERKAESFTVSPLHSGTWRLGYRDSKDYGSRPHIRYGSNERRDYERDNGISLGTAVTISGAAASPNMGYNSSPPLTLLMTLFNVRLGWWLGNPGTAGDSTYRLAEPAWGLRPLFAEAFGQTDDHNKYIYLSDGGHFENLGLYEMVLRRCHYIVVSDASDDLKYTFRDLGNAIEKIRIDLGIPITFKEFNIQEPPEDKLNGGRNTSRACAVAQIEYNKVDGDVEPGILIYLKPLICGTEPQDILNYKARYPSFPHQSTVDQWFSESQFESYRMLGYHIVYRMMDDDDRAPLDNFDQFRERIAKYLRAAPAEHGPDGTASTTANGRPEPRPADSAPERVYDQTGRQA